jgi:hypothetical protein
LEELERSWVGLSSGAGSVILRTRRLSSSLRLFRQEEELAGEAEGRGDMIYFILEKDGGSTSQEEEGGEEETTYRGRPGGGREGT